MKCANVRNRIQALSHPRKAPENLREHVRACARCQAWLKGAMEVESALSQLPIPSPPRGLKDQLIARFRDTPIAETVIEATLVEETLAEPIRPLAVQPRERFWTRFVVGVTLAASVAAVAVWIGNRPARSPNTDALVRGPSDELLKTVLEKHVALAANASPAERLKGLRDLATALRQESMNLKLIASGPDMQSLADMYVKVIRDGVIPQASQVRNPEILADVRAELESAARETQEAIRAATATASSMGPLRQIVKASEEGDSHIRVLLKGGAS